MKTTLIIFFLFCQNVCLAQNRDYSLFCGDYTFISFMWSKTNAWPVYFNTVVKQDTIYADITNLDTFAKSVYSVNPYVPVYDNPYQSAINIMCGKSYETYGFGLELLNKFTDEFNETAKEGKIKILTGGYIYYKYADLKAIFIELDKLRDWRHLSSNEIRDSSIVNRMVLPISIINCTTKNNKIRFVTE